MVVGTVDVRAYTDNSGQPAASLELTARDVRFLGAREGQGQGQGQPRGDYNDFAPPAEDIGDIPF
jgi:single-stranded DNA-binding protein